eukprot:symbB.v1.2.026458.t1/scaffold2647.1/size76802/3
MIGKSCQAPTNAASHPSPTFAAVVLCWAAGCVTAGFGPFLSTLLVTCMRQRRRWTSSLVLLVSLSFCCQWSFFAPRRPSSPSDGPEVRDRKGRSRLLARAASTFGNQEYWEEFYSGDSEDSKDFEWFCSYEDVQPFFHEFVQPVLDASTTRPAKILVAGCGNSRLTCDIYDDLCTTGINAGANSPDVEIWNVDYAEAAIARSKETAGERRSIRHVVADLRDLPPETFQNESFDAVVDKGTMDALFCAGGSSARRCCGELHRVLRPHGVLLMMSGVAPTEDLLEMFQSWTQVVDGSPYITDEGEASINLCSKLFVFQK